MLDKSGPKMNPTATILVPRDIINMAVDAYPGIVSLSTELDADCPTSCAQSACDNQGVQLIIFCKCNVENGGEVSTPENPQPDIRPIDDGQQREERTYPQETLGNLYQSDSWFDGGNYDIDSAIGTYGVDSVKGGGICNINSVGYRYTYGADLSSEERTYGFAIAMDPVIISDQSDASCRRQKRKGKRACSYCKSNRETVEVRKSHVLYRDGKVTCPILRMVVCPICNATGDFAHTLKYCPFEPTAAAHSYKKVRNATGCKRLLKRY